MVLHIPDFCEFLQHLWNIPKFVKIPKLSEISRSFRKFGVGFHKLEWKTMTFCNSGLGICILSENLVFYLILITFESLWLKHNNISTILSISSILGQF